MLEGLLEAGLEAAEDLLGEMAALGLLPTDGGRRLAQDSMLGSPDFDGQVSMVALSCLMLSSSGK